MHDKLEFFDFDSFSNARILVIGDVMLDRYWFGDVDRVSPEAPVPVVSVKNTTHRLGGAANVAQNVVALGAACTLLSVVGDDEAGQMLSTLLSEAGIQSHLSIDPDIDTTIKLRLMSQNKQLIRIDFEKTPNHEILARLLDDFKSALQHTDIVIISDYGKGGLLHIEEMIKAAREQNIPIMIDPKGTDFSRYSAATVITPNRKELQAVVGPWETDAERDSKIQSLLDTHNFEYILLTLSEQGMLLCNRNGGKTYHPAHAREVYDVTGAGDTVISTIAVASAAGLSKTDAMHLANITASIVVGKLGTACASRAEIEATLKME